jgi:hypothetical protein
MCTVAQSVKYREFGRPVTTESVVSSKFLRWRRPTPRSPSSTVHQWLMAAGPFSSRVPRQHCSRQSAPDVGLAASQAAPSCWGAGAGTRLGVPLPSNSEDCEDCEAVGSTPDAEDYINQLTAL